jgi:hypothetical protein
LAAFWRVKRDRVEHYGNEAGLEHAFIQPVLESLGWHLKYQTFLQGRKPDYALFTADSTLGKSLRAGHDSADFWKQPVVVADAR